MRIPVGVVLMPRPAEEGEHTGSIRPREERSTKTELLAGLGARDGTIFRIAIEGCPNVDARVLATRLGCGKDWLKR